MSLSVYKDLDKSTRDIFSDDFDTKFTLKVKSEAPAGVAVTTTTDCNCGSSPFTSKVSLKWAHETSGFVVDKLEIAGRDKVKLETSLSNLAPGLKLEFKGSCASSGNLGAIYKHQLATIATDLDIAGFSSANVSVLGGSNGILAGASANLALAGKFEVKDFSTAIAYKPSANIFAGIVANKKFSEFNAALQYQVKPNLTVAALVDVVPKSSSHKINFAANFNCCPNTSVKVKVNNDGLINASVKHQLPKKLTVVGAAEFDTRNTSTFNFGVTATLG